MSEKVDKFLYKVTLKVLLKGNIINIHYYTIARNSNIAIKLCLDQYEHSTYFEYSIDSINVIYIASTSYGIDKLLVEKEI